MKRKWHKDQFGIETLAPSSEFLPRKYKVRVVDLRKFGVQTVPVVGQTSYRRLDEPSGWHVHEGCIELIYCSAGTCEYESRGNRYRLGAGMMFVSRPDEEHRQLDCPKGYANLYLHFKPSANSVSRWFENALTKLPRLFLCGRTIPMRFGRIFSLAEGRKPERELQIRLQTEIHALLLDVIDSSGRSLKKFNSKNLDAIAQRMRQNPEKDYPLEALIAESGMSKASFMVLFKESYGYSPHAYLLFRRVEAAKVLLKKGVPEKEVAERLGFASTQNLSRAFVNYVGVRPGRWVAREKT